MMKLYFKMLFGVLLFVPNLTKAQTLIAVQGESGSSFYSILDSAIVKANDGDFIYLPGGSFRISKPINKKLQIIGVGHNPDSCAATGITQVTGTFTINSGSDHGSIIGLKIYGSISFSLNTGQTINSYLIERCNLDGVTLATQSTNILINECVIKGSVNGSSSRGILVSKCILEGGVGGFVANTFISNNIFLNAITFPTVGCDFKNNIFLAFGPAPNASNSDFYQNNSFTSAVSSLHNCHNNILAPVANLFVKKDKTGFDYDQNYHVLATSTAHNAGTDSTDLGIYGTASPWKEGSIPGNPHVQTKTISTLNGKPNAKIKVAAQDF